MSYTDSELAALRRAYASGVVEVVYDGKRTTYDNGAALLARIREIEGQISAESGATGRVMAMPTTYKRK